MAASFGTNSNLSGAPESPTDDAVLRAQSVRKEIGREKDQWRSSLLEMLIADARDGNVKDPFGRNAKGRSNKVGTPSRVGRRLAPGARTQPQEKSQPTDGAMVSIDAAQESVDTLRRVTSDDLSEEDGRLKIVNLAKLV